MYKSFWLKNANQQPLLFESEKEVWEKVNAINTTGEGISPVVHGAFKRLVDEIIRNRNKSAYHPLDYSIFRYFLLGELHLVHLPYVFHPDFLAEVRKWWGDDRVGQFFCELNAEKPAELYNRTAPLRGVWNCAKYVEQIGGKITTFHIKSPDDNSKGGCDVLFSFENDSWHCEVKHLLHPDFSLYCIANSLAGMLYLKEEGKSLRKYRCITLDGKSIDDGFRNEVIAYIHKQINATLAKIEEEPKTRRIPPFQEHGFKVTIYPFNKKITLKSISEPSCEIQFSLHKDQESDPPYDFYDVGPSSAYMWPEPLTTQFFDKLDRTIKKVKCQLKDKAEHTLGFLYLDLPDANIDKRKASEESQEWEQSIKDRLDKEDYPLILMTEPMRISRQIYIINDAAQKSGL